MRPEFDPEEEYLVAHYRMRAASARSWGGAREVAVLVVGVALFAAGFLTEDPGWFIAGMAIVIWRQVDAIFSGVRYERIFARVVAKYESACCSQADALPQGERLVGDGGNEAEGVGAR